MPPKNHNPRHNFNWHARSLTNQYEQPSADTADGFIADPVFQGGRFDPEQGGLYDFVQRAFIPTAKRWMDQDPLGYVDGINAYTAQHDNPIQTDARDNNPNMYIWISADPLGYVDGANWYLPMADNPINRVDPRGLAAEPSSGRGGKGGPSIVQLPPHVSKGRPPGYKAPTGKCPPTPGVEVYSTGKWAGILGGAQVHTFIVVTRDDGSQIAFRAGPQGGGGASSGTAIVGTGVGAYYGGLPGGIIGGGVGSGVGSSYTVSSPTAPGNLGLITTDHGPYDPSFGDWDPGAKTMFEQEGYSREIEASLLRSTLAIDAAHIPYYRLSQNSNSFTYTLLLHAGIHTDEPVNAPAPGWGLDLLAFQSTYSYISSLPGYDPGDHSVENTSQPGGVGLP